MTGAAAIYEANRQAVLDQLRVVRLGHGAACASIVATAVLAAVGEFVREAEGSEAAFNALTREADAVIAPVIERAGPHPHPHGDRT